MRHTECASLRFFNSAAPPVPSTCFLASTPQVTALGLFKEALIAPIIAAAAAAAAGGVPAHLAAEMKPFAPDSGEPPRVKQEQVGPRPPCW